MCRCGLGGGLLWIGLGGLGLGLCGGGRSLLGFRVMGSLLLYGGWDSVSEILEIINDRVINKYIQISINLMKS